MDRLKKIGLVLLFVGVTAGLGYLLFRFFFGAPGVEPTDTGEEPVPAEPSDGLPSAGDFVPGEPGTDGVPGLEGSEFIPPPPSLVAAGGRTVTEEVTPNSVLSAVLSPNGNLTYYDEDEGRFYAIGPDGRPVLLTNRRFPAAENVVWSPGTDKAIIEFPDDVKVVYDFESETQTTLPSHWQDFSFTGDGESIAAKTLGLDPDNRWLITANVDGSNARLVEHLGENADKVTVKVSPNNSVLAFSETGNPVGFDTKEIILLGQNDENFKALRVEGFNFEPVWSPNGKNIIYSASAQADGYRPTLWFVSADGERIGENRTNLGINTWAEKCTFANDSVVYCAVPDALPAGIGLQPDLATGSGDTVFRIDLTNGSVKPVGKPEDSTEISHIVVSKDESTLFLRGAGSGRISEMRLR